MFPLHPLRFAAAIWLTLLAAAAQPSPPGGFICAPFGPGGTWNLYQTSKEPLTWAEAQKLAEETADPKGGTGKRGHLVTIGSAAENMFVYQYVQGWYVWIGLTDNEQYGGTEAGCDRRGGWRWVTGEPLGEGFALWRGVEPNAVSEGGEDAVAMEYAGRWADWPMGAGTEEKHQHPFLIEWDTALAQPVEGVRTIGRVLPARWPADLLAGKDERTGAGPWTTFSTEGVSGESLRAMLEDFLPALTPDGHRYGMERLNYRNKDDAVPCAGGWIAVTDEPRHPVQLKDCGALHVATVRVEKQGTWSFNIHGDDFFAARFPGHKWKRVCGMAGTDPLDPETMFQDTESGDAQGIGIIELPAGEHRMEIFLGNRVNGMMLQVLAAPGEFTSDGATDRWRVPGHKAAGDLAWPGLTAPGWTVTQTPTKQGAPPLRILHAAFALHRAGADQKTAEVPVVNFHDPAAAGDLLFANPRPFPADAPGAQQQFAVVASATLVIPRDGDYHFGVASEACSALCIGGQTFTSFIRRGGYNGRIDKDTVWEEFADRNAAGANNVAQLTLKKGEYPVEVLYASTGGPPVLSVFGGPANYPPRLLEAGKAGLEPDVDGLPLVQPGN